MKVKRKVAFEKLPKADPLNDKPSESSHPQLGEEAAEALLPGWYQPEAKDEIPEGGPGEDEESLFDEKQWEEFVARQPKGEERGDPKGFNSMDVSGKKRSVLDVLAEKHPSESPQAIANETRRQVVYRGKLADVPHGTSLERLQAIGLRLAMRRGAADPAFETSKAVGLGSKDWPPPGTSFGLFGFRGSGGRSMTTATEIEADRLYHDQEARRHGTSVGNLHSAPLTAELARRMEPGERYRIYGERVTFVDAGLKFTPTPFGLLSSSPFHDIGPYAQGEAISAVEGDAVTEVIGGPDQTVSVTVAVGRERARPLASDNKMLRRLSKDGSVKIGVGAFIDGSVVDLFFSKLAEEQVANELDDLQKRKTEIDLALTPHLEETNRKLDLASYEHRGQVADDTVTAYEMVFDLKNPQAREIYEQVVGTAAGKEKGAIDFTGLENLPEDSGVKVVANHVSTASRRGIDRTVRFFGWESQKGTVTEKIDEVTDSKKKGKIHSVQENHGLVRRKRNLSRSTDSTLVARIKTRHEEKSDKRRSGVGLGWRFTIDDPRTSVNELSELLSFAAVADPDGKAPGKLEELRDKSASMPRAKWLGLPIGRRGAGRSKATLSVELSSKAVDRLLEHVRDPTKKQVLWNRLAEAYRLRRGLDEAPDWPIESLNDDGWAATLKRNLTAFGPSKDAFLIARNGIKLLEEAAESEDPVRQGQALVQAFDCLSTDLYLAGAFLGVARGAADSPEMELAFELRSEHFVKDKETLADASPKPIPEVDQGESSEVDGAEGGEASDPEEEDALPEMIVAPDEPIPSADDEPNQSGANSVVGHGEDDEAPQEPVDAAAKQIAKRKAELAAAEEAAKERPPPPPEDPAPEPAG